MKPEIGLMDKNRDAVVKILNTTLADEMVLLTKTRNYHWNVTGPQFNDLHKRGRDVAKFDLEAMAGTSQDFSGAEIEEAINSALYDAFYTHCELATAHVLAALAETVPLAKTMDEQINRLRSWAEGRARNASAAKSAKGPGEARRMEF